MKPPLNNGKWSADAAENARRRMGLGRRHWRYEIPIPLTLERVKPFQLLFVRVKSMISAAIVYFEGVGCKRAWVSHVGQVMADGRTVSEANWPEHSFTPIEHYLDLQRSGEARLTLAEIVPGTFGMYTGQAMGACEHYHANLGRDMAAEFARRRIKAPPNYQLSALIPMALTSMARRLIPWTGGWRHIPQPYETATFICSGIVDWGWGEGQRLINKDLWPSSLSGSVPSPQDMIDSPAVRYVAGTQKVYTDRPDGYDLLGYPEMANG